MSKPVSEETNANAEETRRCTKCRKMQPLSEFYKESRRDDGLKPWCRTCITADVSARRSKDREGYLAKSRVYNRKRKAQLQRGIELERLTREYFSTLDAFMKAANHVEASRMNNRLVDLEAKIRALLAQPVE